MGPPVVTWGGREQEDGVAEEQPQMRPEKTMLVCKHNGKEVGRIPATAHNASKYVEELALHYKEMTVDYEYNEHAGMLALLHGPR